MRTSGSPAPSDDTSARAPADASAEGVVPRALVTERLLLSALREQDATAASELGRARAQFLADAGLRLGASLDQEVTYAAVAELSLPGRDAWSIVDLVDAGGGLRRLAVVHPDERRRAVARALVGRWMPAPDDPIGVPAVERDRVPVLITDRADAAISATARDADTLRVLRWLGAGSLLVVPVVAHGLLLGAITYVSRPGAPPFAAEDVVLGEALAARCAQAIESACLYAAARAARAEAEAARADADAARAVAEAANATKAEFLGRMSHELRTPLNAIAGYAQLVELGIHGPVTAEQQRDLAGIQRSQAHLLGLVDAVLDYAQLGAGRVTYTITRMPLVDVVAGVRALVAPQMRAKGLLYTMESCDVPMTAYADAEKVRQIVLNLLSNATKFTPAGGRVTVAFELVPPAAGRVGEDGPAMLAVRVTDTGIGIATEQLERVFAPFVQVDHGLTSAAVGVGLGLAISRDLARGMGGDLTAESTVGVGSTFTLTLPHA